MIKQAPSIPRMLAMVGFALSCIGLLLFLWLAFGGSIPLRPEGYRFTVEMPEAATLAKEADVRLAGVNVGKVKDKQLDKRGARTKVTIELKSAYAPIAKDTRAILRQKTLLGETYVELAPGHPRSAGTLKDGSQLANSQVEPTVEVDEIFNSFDRPTRRAFQEWVAELSKVIDKHGGQDLNDSFGNLAGFSVDGAKLFKVLDEQEIAVRRLIKNTGIVFGAINERQGALRQLVVNANNTFEATASRDQALAQTFAIFPTFLDESKATMARLNRFSRNTRPLVNALKRPADDLGPTVHDLGELAPDLERLFRNLPGLIDASRTGLPAAKDILKGLEPVLESAHVFFPQLNPILSYFNFHQVTISNFITNGAADLNGFWSGQRGQEQIGIIDGRSFEPHAYGDRPEFERGQAYLAPNALQRAIALGGIESFDCANTASGGEQRDAVDSPPPGGDKQPPCFVQPGSLYNGKQFVIPQKGQAPKKPPPIFRQGNSLAVDPNPGDPSN
jgi:phospholipid/cholesterol/gamma-HCH transport system substrate-binding protein